MNLDAALYPAIFKRKSFHLFRGIWHEALSAEEIAAIYAFYAKAVPLDAGIQTAIKIVPAKETSSKLGQEYCILLYSEKKDGYLQNIGYLGQQLDLYLVSKRIGSLWLGMGKTKEQSDNGLDFVIMLAIAKVDDESKFRKEMFKSKRKPKEEIWTGPDLPGVTDIVRFAPSACNSQPWLVEHETEGSKDTLQVYRYKKPGKVGIIPARKVVYYNRIDMGIFLCFLELCLAHEGIPFERARHTDAGTEAEKTLVATYRLGSY